MNLKTRLIVMSFLQFFVWGAWLITVANYWFGTKQWDGTQFGAIFSTLAIASIFLIIALFYDNLRFHYYNIKRKVQSR